MDLGRHMEKEIKRWLGVGTEKGPYMVCDGRRIQWRDLEEIEEGKMVEVVTEMKGGMSKKKSKKNPCITPSQSSTGCEPEIIRTETGGSSVEERDYEQLLEVLEMKVTQALER